MDEYYVNPSSGNDTFTGSKAQPFATIAKAILEASPGDTIYLARGYTYSALHISGKDGSAGSPYTWAAYGIGTDPIISAFVDPAGSWTDEGGNIWSYQNGLFDQVNVLAVARTNQPLARWPKSEVAEYYPIDAASGNASITDNTNLAAAPNFVGGELVSKKRKWTIDRATITGQTSSTLSVAGFDSNYVVGNGYFVQNHINCLTAQGDWCYEAGTDTVYFYSTTDPNSLDIAISLDEHALHLESSEYHAFHNLIFEGGSRHNIFLEFSHHASFTGCVSRLAGIDGLKTFVSENVSWIDGYMYDTNNHGVNNRDASEGLTVTGSSFVRIASIPGLGQSGSGQQNGVHINNTEHNALIDGNFFFQVGNNGVSYRGNNCYVARNYAEKCGWTVSDAAAFYSFGNFANPDTNVICEFNIAYDCRGNIDGIGGTPRYDTCGFYTDDNCRWHITRYNIARKCGYGYYIHNNDGVVYRYNIAEDCDVLFRFADDTTQGVSTTRRIRNIDVQFNTLKALPGQLVYEARVLGVFAGDAPFDFGTIDNNQIDAADANPINAHLTNNFDNMINLAAWRTDYGFDPNSTTDPYDPSDTVFFVNDTAVPKAFSLDGVYEDWDQVENATGEVILDPSESVLLFRVGDFPGPGYPVNYVRGFRFVETAP
ncbi:DUF1565 domain-containing protein [Cyclobacterium xiamenense]|uniref:DUF1565 domain-containing protein n=1 Tax=Cyclobacterium xiamenense TaxID=1297121 RepID=UPI0035CEA402